MRAPWLLLALAACKGGPDASASDDHAKQAEVADVHRGGHRADGHRADGRRPDLDSQQARFDEERHPDAVVAALALTPGQVVADIGAGTGLMTMHLARAVGPTGRVVATDIDGDVLDMLAERMNAAGVGERVQRRVVISDQPGLEAGGYDAILLAQVDQYLPDRVVWLRAAMPALKPGGRLVITNRLYHRAAALDAAARAGLTRRSESTDVPGQFIAVFTAEKTP